MASNDRVMRHVCFDVADASGQALTLTLETATGAFNYGIGEISVNVIPKTKAPSDRVPTDRHRENQKRLKKSC